MKVIRAFCLCWLLMLADGVSAQLVDKVLSVLGVDSVGSVTVARTDSDSIQLSLVRQELETARLNEANLRMEMEQMKQYILIILMNLKQRILKLLLNVLLIKQFLLLLQIITDLNV